MIRILVTLIVFAASFSVCADEGQSEIALVYRNRQRGKPPLQYYICDLVIKNTRNTPVWIVWPDAAENRLPSDGLINVSYWEPQFFSADGFEIEKGYLPRRPENVGRFVRIHSLAGERSADHFYAIRLPEGATFKFEDYPFETWVKVDSIEFIEASDISINRSVSLVDWVPYDVTADKEVNMKKGTHLNDNMNFDKKTSKTRTDLRSEPVKQIQIKIMSRRVVAMAGAEPVKPPQANGGQPTTYPESK